MSFLRYLREDMSTIEQRRQKLQARKDVWEKSKQELISQIKYHTEQMEMVFDKLESGLDYTGNVQSDLDSIKTIFEKIKDTEEDIKVDEGNIDADEEDLRWEKEHGR